MIEIDSAVEWRKKRMLQRKHSKIKWNLVRAQMAKMIKIALGTMVSIMIAMWADLQFTSSAGIITLLSVQDTKRDTIKIGIRRFLSFLMALLIAYVFFSLFGFTVVGFGLFLFLFLGCSYYFQLTEGISMSAVLMTHFLTKKEMSMALIGNELALFVIGVGIGVIVNLFMITDTERIRSDMRQVEEVMKQNFVVMIRHLTTKYPWETNVLGDAEHCIAQALRRAELTMKNRLFSDASYYVQYLFMRKQQLSMMKRMVRMIERVNDLPEQAKALAEFLMEIVEDFHEYNNVEELLVNLEDLKTTYKNQPLPASREEFENRALLYTFLYEIENFLLIKYEFVQGLSEEQIKRFWRQNLSEE